MQKKLYIRYLVQYLFLALLALSLSNPSIAQDLVDAVKESDTQAIAIVYQPNHADAASSTSNDQPEPTSNTAATIQSTEERLAMQAKAMAHLNTVLSTEEKNKAIKQVTPYEQLVKLAFKGKGANGINSYEDAATSFCKLARDDNNAGAQYALGWMHANGKGFDKDEDIAAYFYRKAAAQDHYRATKSLINFKGDETLAQTPECMLPDAPPEPVLSKLALAPAGSNGNEFYQRGPIFDIVDRLAPQYHIETDLAMAFIKVESNFNPKATSPKNAQGLMQLIPATARRFNVRNPYNPEDNIKGGLAYLQWLMAYFEGDVRLVAAAYNAGEGAVDKYKGVPPYPETKKYVTKIYNLYRKSYHPFTQDMLIGKRSEIIQLSSNP